MASESALIARTLRALRQLPQTYAVKNHGGMYGRGGQPDIIGCHCGRLFAIEGKLPGQSLRVRQRVELARWARAGARVGRFTTVDEALAIVQGGQSGQAR